MSHFFISAAHNSSGKTTVTIGLCAALKSRNLVIQPFKKGPDYIDPKWLSQAAGNACHNLDFNTMNSAEIIATFKKYSANADISLVEGNKGLYDGLDLDGSNSNAALAILLNAPVILVIDARGMTRGIAPLILGYQAFEAKLNIAGVILNQLGGSRHESKLRSVIDHYTDVPVLGAVHFHKDLEIVERHLGLIPSNEMQQAQRRIDMVGKRIAEQVDLDRLIEIAKTARLHPATESTDITITSQYRVSTPCRIGIANDAAFGFYYPGDLEAFTDAGATLEFIDTLHDKQLPDIDGLFIGGGFPETQMQALQDNRELRQSIRAAIEAGLPVYAECGGLMYLTRSIRWKDQNCEMVGAIDADTVMHEKPKGRGYVRIRETSKHPWPVLTNQVPANDTPAHEFHYSSLENCGKFDFAYQVLRGTGIDGTHDGIVCNNVLGSYSHLRDVAQNHWVQRFLQFVQNVKNSKAH